MTAASNASAASQADFMWPKRHCSRQEAPPVHPDERTRVIGHSDFALGFELGRKRRLDVGQPLPVYPNKQTVAERHGTSHWGQQGFVSICISDQEAHARPDEEAQFHIAE